jgi:hypothetical protein
MSSSNPPSPPISRELRAAHRARWFFAIVILGPILFLGAHHLYLSFQVNRELTILKKAGIPFTIEDCARDFQARKATNDSAYSYIEALRTFKNLDSIATRSLLGKSGDPKLPQFDEKDRAAFTQLLKTNEPAFQKLDVALQNPRAFYNLEWSEGFAMLLPQEAATKKVSRLLQLRALFAIESHDTPAAIKETERILALADSIAEEPLLISALIRMSCCQSAIRISELLLNNCAVSDDDLVRLEKLFADWTTAPQMIKSFALERAEIIEVFDYPTTLLPAVLNEPNGIAFKLGIYMLRVTGNLQKDRIYFLQQMRQLEEILQTPAPLRYSKLNFLSAAFERERAAIGRSAGSPRIKLVSGIFLGAEIKAIEKQIAIDARLRIALTALAIERFRRQQHRDPSSMGDLVPQFLPAALTDPYTGQPIQFKSNEKGLLVFCHDPRTSAPMNRTSTESDTFNPPELQLPKANRQN